MAELDENEIETEIVPFLLPLARRDLRAIAVRYFLGLTGSEQGRHLIIKKPKYIEQLSDLINDENIDVAKDVSMIFVNLAADYDIIAMLPNLQLIAHLLKAVLSIPSVNGSIAAMALSNLTRCEQSATVVASFMLKEQDQNMSICKLIEVLCSKAGYQLEHLASFLSNLTQVLEVRRLILHKDRCLMQGILPYINCEESLVIRSGVVAAVRNCLFEIDSHEWLLNEQVDILPRLLLPLAGPEEFDEDDMEKLPLDLQYLEPDKKREPVANIRCMLVEAIHKLCALKSCREIVKNKNAYVILRELHKWETDEANIVAIENLVSLLISDEPEPGMENLNEVSIPDHLVEKLSKVTENDKSDSVQ